MKIIATTLFSAFLTVSLPSAEPLYTQGGTDPSFAAVQESSGGKAGPIPKDIGLHTEFSGGISHKDFGPWTRWYQKQSTNIGWSGRRPACLTSSSSRAQPTRQFSRPFMIHKNEIS
ncbi:MAG: hypothetical protein WCO56_06270 [Verrucomicrobiota bacterium]